MDGTGEHYEFCVTMGKETLQIPETLNQLHSCIQQLGTRLQDPEALAILCSEIICKKNCMDTPLSSMAIGNRHGTVNAEKCSDNDNTSNAGLFF